MLTPTPLSSAISKSNEMVLLVGGHHVIAAGTMKTIYWLVTIAAVAAVGVTVYARLAPSDPVPTVPLATEAAAKDVPRLTLPPVVIPPDEPLALPDVPGKPTTSAPMPISARKPDSPPPSVTPVSASEPVVSVPPLPNTDPPPPPVPPASVPLPKSSDTPLPIAPPPLPLPKSNADPLPFPVEPPKEVSRPALVLQPPSPPTPVPPPAPAAVRSDTPPVSPESIAVGGKYVILNGDKLIEGSSISLRGEIVVVRQGILDRPFPKSEVQFVATSKDEVYKFMLAKVPATDPSARLKVARWCMFSGMREQALAEAREVQRIAPNNTSAADMIRSLELSLQQFPAANTPKMSVPTVPTFPAELKSTPAPIPPANDPDPDVTPESALVFASRVQPFLANQCVSCHANPEYTGKFKLARITATEAGPQATRINLRAVAGQLKKDDPGASPLLVKTRTAHGGMQRPAVEGVYVIAYQTLESWVALAVGTPIAAPGTAPMPTPSVPMPVTPIAPPTMPVPPSTPVETIRPPMPPVEAPLPPVGMPIVVPPTPPVSAPPPLPVPPPMRMIPIPPSEPAISTRPYPTTPVVPVAPPTPQTIPLPPQGPPTNPLPVPPPSPPRIPTPVPPAIPPADSGRNPETVPMIPAIPPVSATPKPPTPVVPTSGSQFGVAMPPKVPATGPSGDEFDPEGFNQQRPPR